MATLAFVLLIAALILFSISTRQWTLWLRGSVWAGGLVLLVVAWFLLGDSARDPELLTALGDFVAKLNRPGESMLIRMLESNGATVARIVLSLFDLFLFSGLVVGIAALVAFTPGEQLERIIRPIMTGIVGAILGGLLALAIVGAGFGEGEQRQSYAGPVLSETVHNGETLLLNGDLVRLRGIDAPESGQVCRINNRTQDCDAEAQRALRRIIEGTFVMCVLEDRDRPPAERGLRIATCTAVRNSGEQFNVARRMVEEGFAIGIGTNYQAETTEAISRARGLTTWCAVQPDTWARFTQAQRTAFRDRGTYPANTPMMGTCPRRPRAPGERTPPAVSAPD
jgi:endonuclease YncB( thermonuclease family)